MEFQFVDHPTGAVHVAWIDEPDWVVNPHFVTEIRQLMLGGVTCEPGEPCAPIILICRSGKRSKEAGDLLLAGASPADAAGDLPVADVEVADEADRAVGRAPERPA